MNPNKELWEKGDFTEIAAFMRQSGEAVVKPLGITPPLRVLDLGCGDGTTAVPLALLGAEVVGIDIARNLVEAGNKRAAKAGLNRLKFQEGDACNLQGVSDHSFELHSQLVELAKAQNQSTDGGTSIPATFLRVTVCL
jgi:ubiquinone/menaquinone biosynthesis C-methylase UbiE